MKREPCIYFSCRAHNLCVSTHCVGRVMLERSNQVFENGTSREATPEERTRYLQRTPQ